jgi:16S rRNA (cytidine(1402)-2'-O)-methyltransferase
MGKLFVVPTPVGNLEDMTFRAIRVLKEADLILAEDTRTSGILLKHFEIKNAMQSHHKFNEHKTVESVVNRIKAGETVALISDAGTPGISDPGFLVRLHGILYFEMLQQNTRCTRVFGQNQIGLLQHPNSAKGHILQISYRRRHYKQFSHVVVNYRISLSTP